MSNKFILPNGIIAEEAEYKEQFIDEYNSNPFIQALPTIKNREEIIKILNKDIKISKKELEADGYIKEHLLQRIYKIFQVLPIHLRVWNMINTLIRQGYIERNPFNSEYRRHINKLGNNLINKDFSINVNSNFITTASCGLLVGFSGMGKTTIVNKVLENIPQVICHHTYNKEDFNNIQVSWIKLEAPHNSSLKALTLQFFMKVDGLIGTENMKRYAVKNLSVDAMLPIMGQLANNIGLGLLVVDELQHLNRNTTEIMNYFVALMNTFGVPILLIGTPACYDMLTQELRIARRVTGSGEIIWNNMKNDKEFRLFMKGIWKYQYLKNSSSLDENMINLFYEKTQGISDLIVKLFVNTQMVAIQTNIEQVTKELVEKVWTKKFKLLKPMINSIQRNNKAQMFKYSDIRVLDTGSAQNRADTEIKYDKKKTKFVKSKIKVNNLESDDIRRIVIEGMREGKTNYKSLMDSGLISDIDTILKEKNL
ncbi:ATP-binding protein [Clostridium ljungdahlii]|uniref:Transposon Tn7 transposition protein TnsC n=1 Tax=Clostridium ljungdahlii TaxID=1538 RepID=A0A168MRZ6_9CLOT|nr:ATP-binding protein [Clostridium ljungdahlii]OAA85081.1 Transposon Tn7 transposition protein TnsC [Clostridium ljungdahlii]